MKRMIDIYPDYYKTNLSVSPKIRSGVFSDVVFFSVQPEFITNDDIISLDMLFGDIHSERLPSGYLRGTVTDEMKSRFSQMFYTVYGDKWQRIFEALAAEYGILDNTDATVHEEYVRTNTGTVGNSGSTVYGRTETETKALKDTEEITHGKTTTDTFNDTVDTTNNGETVVNKSTGTNTSYYGFNSSAQVKTSTSDGSSGYDDTTMFDDTTVDHTGTITHADSGKTKTVTDYTGTDGTVTGGTDTQNNTRTDNLSEGFSRTETRKGNIGVTTAQQMLSQELDFRQKSNLYRIMVEDVASVLTLSIY